MKCNICDKTLTEKEISQHDQTKEFEPCGTCLEIALDAAYSDGFAHPDDEPEGAVDPDFDNSYGDSTDIVVFNSWWKEFE